jgi:hypothetical protein
VNKKLSTMKVAGKFVNNINSRCSSTEIDTWICYIVIYNHVCIGGARSFDGCPSAFQRSVARVHTEGVDLIGV